MFVRRFAFGISIFLAGASSAVAAEPSLTLTAGAATDYVYRGVSQTRGGPEIFASVDLEFGPLYGGVSAENVEFEGDAATRAEFDVYGGARTTWRGWSLEAGAALYTYPDAPESLQYDYFEAGVKLGRAVGATTLGGGFYYAPDYFGGTGAARYLEVTASRPLTDKLSVSGAAGVQDVGYDGDYATWNLGLGWAPVERIAFDLRYSDTNRHAYGSAYGERVAFAVKATF